MKTLFKILPLFLSFSAFAVNGATITSHEASMDLISSEIKLHVTYNGCEDQKFDLEIDGCLESMPVQCESVLSAKQESDKATCDETHTKTLKYTAEELGLVGDYFDGGSLGIFVVETESEVSIDLPQSCKFMQYQLDSAKRNLNSEHEAWKQWAERAVVRYTEKMEKKKCPDLSQNRDKERGELLKFEGQL